MRNLALFACVLALSSCYNKEFNEPGRVEHERRPTERIYESDFNRVWAATQKVLSRFPVAETKTEQAGAKAFIVSDWVTGKSDVLYSGYDRNRIPYIIRYKLYVYVQGGRGRTKVTIKNVEQYKDDFVTAGTDVAGSVNTWIRTESSTLKEFQILEDIDRVIKDRNFTPQ